MTRETEETPIGQILEEVRERNDAMELFAHGVAVGATEDPSILDDEEAFLNAVRSNFREVYDDD